MAGRGRVSRREAGRVGIRHVRVAVLATGGVALFSPSAGASSMCQRCSSCRCRKKMFIHGLGLNQSSALLQKTVQHTAPGMVAGFINSESRPSFSVVEVSYRL